MDKGIYVALGSLKADKVKQGNAIHDVANVSTIGFKKAFEAKVTTYRVDIPGSLTFRQSKPRGWYSYYDGQQL